MDFLAPRYTVWLLLDGSISLPPRNRTRNSWQWRLSDEQSLDEYIFHVGQRERFFGEEGPCTSI